MLRLNGMSGAWHSGLVRDNLLWLIQSAVCQFVFISYKPNNLQPSLAEGGGVVLLYALDIKHQWVCSAETSWFYLSDNNGGSSQEIVSSLVPISQADRRQRAAWRNAVTHAADVINRNSRGPSLALLLYSGCLLVVSGVGNGSVHLELVALHLVELVPGVRILTRSDQGGADVKVLVEILPAHLTCTQKSQ